MNDNEISRQVLKEIMGLMDRRDRDELTGRFIKKPEPKPENKKSDLIDPIKETPAAPAPEAEMNSVDPVVLLAKRYG